MSNIFFSVIIPVYNVKEYLNQCVDSVLAQDFADYELILVDDGSTDASGEVCDEYAKADRRVQVIHKKNGGLSDARNAGLEIANGHFIWFLDSDDWLTEKSAFSVVADILDNKNADVVFFSYKKYWDVSDSFSDNLYKYVAEVDDISGWIKANAYKALACNKVVQRTLIEEHTMSFPVGRFGEDLTWCADLLTYAKKIEVCVKPLFAYRQHEGSITGSKNKKSRRQLIEDALFLINETVSKYALGADGNSGNELIGHYLAYEFSWLLGEVHPFWREYSREVRKLSFLLDYDLNYKTAKVKKLKQIFGLWGSSFALYLFIKIKKCCVG
jgi:glycosyltransferase involved in cell wall biosynthesis